MKTLLSFFCLIWGMSVQAQTFNSAEYANSRAASTSATATQALATANTAQAAATSAGAAAATAQAAATAAQNAVNLLAGAVTSVSVVTTSLATGSTPTLDAAITNNRLTLYFARAGSTTATSGTSNTAVTALQVDGLNAAGAALSEGTTALVDRSQFNRTVTASGGAKSTLLQNKYGGSSIEFTGGNPVVVVTETAANSLTFATGAIDIDLWVRPTAFGGSGTSPVLIGRASATDPQWCINMKPAGAGCGFVIWNSAGTASDQVATTFQFTLNTWANIVVTRDEGSGTMRLFIDGILGGGVTGVGSFQQGTVTGATLL